jgi:hypothetical protein
LKVNGILPCSVAGSGMQFWRHLTIHEYQAMDLLRASDIPVPDYKIATSADETFLIAEEFGNLHTCTFLLYTKVLASIVLLVL